MVTLRKTFLTMLAAFACMAAPRAAGAEADSLPVVRPVLASYTAAVGSAHVVDTYLTPLHYNGWNMELRYERMQAMRFDPDHWTMRLQGMAWGGETHNTAYNALMDNFSGRLQWSMLRRWKPVEGLRVLAGGTTDIEGGVLYLRRNSNNPASARAAWTVGVDAEIAWSTKLWRLPLTLRYAATMPLTGAFFAPSYGELYWEIYLGNHKNLLHWAWSGNYFRMDNLLTADLHFGATTLRLGYNAAVSSWSANNLVFREIRHQFVLGIVSEWISLAAGSRDIRHARIINAL